MWEKPITDFCYAGKVSCFVIINTGEMLTCPKSIVIGNFFEGDLLTESAVAKCPQKHCFVCHNWLGFGSCPPRITPIICYREIVLGLAEYIGCLKDVATLLDREFVKIISCIP